MLTIKKRLSQVQSTSSMLNQRKGQINLSFGMIFSIILIIVFISFAFYAIGKFLDIQKSAKTGQFAENLRTDVDKMWRSSQGSQNVEYQLPAGIEYVCFADFSSAKIGAKKDWYDDLRMVHFENENIFFYPIGSAGGVDSARINNIDLFEITKKENPYCIINADGKIKMTIKKELDQALVTITR